LVEVQEIKKITDRRKRIFFIKQILFTNK